MSEVTKISVMTREELMAPVAMLDRIQKRGLLIGVVFGIALLIGAFVEPVQFFRSYLLGFMLWLGMTLGGLALLTLQYLTKGNWGFIIRRQLEAASRLVPLMFIFFLPILFDVALGHKLYPWSNSAKIMPELAVQMKFRTWLKPDLFIYRAIGYFVIWFLIEFFLNRWSLEQDVHDSPDLPRSQRYQKVSAPGLILYSFLISVAAVDWVMSLDPHWYSTMYGMIFMDGQGLIAMCFCIIMSVALARYKPMSEILKPTFLQDLGNLTLAMVMIWGYLTFSQFLIIWSGNLPEEIEWFLNRFKGGWSGIGAFIAIFHFCVPFFLLLMKPLKRNPKTLVPIALWLIFMRYMDLYWYIIPNFDNTRGHLSFSWMDAVAPIAIGGLWMAAFCWQLKKRPLFPVYDPLWEEMKKLKYGHS